MNFNQGADLEDMVSTRLWIDPHRVISLERNNVKAIRNIDQRFMLGKGPKSAGDFLTHLTALLFEAMAPVLSNLDEAMDAVESIVLEQPDRNVAFQRKFPIQVYLWV